MSLNVGLLFFKEVGVQHELILSDLCSEQEGEQYVGGNDRERKAKEENENENGRKQEGRKEEREKKNEFREELLWKLVII